MVVHTYNPRMWDHKVQGHPQLCRELKVCLSYGKHYPVKEERRLKMRKRKEEKRNNALVLINGGIDKDFKESRRGNGVLDLG